MTICTIARFPPGDFVGHGKNRSTYAKARAVGLHASEHENRQLPPSRSILGVGSYARNKRRNVTIVQHVQASKAYQIIERSDPRCLKQVVE